MNDNYVLFIDEETSARKVKLLAQGQAANRDRGFELRQFELIVFYTHRICFYSPLC